MIMPMAVPIIWRLAPMQTVRLHWTGRRSARKGTLWSGVFNAGSITTALPFAYSRLTPVKTVRITIATRCWCVSAIAGRFVGCQPNNNSDRNPGLDLDLGADLDHLPGRHSEEGGGAFGVALQEGKKRFPP